VNTPKNKKNAPSEENKKRKRTKHKLISLNDLVPDQDVTGGHHVLFGATDTTQNPNSSRLR